MPKMRPLISRAEEVRILRLAQHYTKQQADLGKLITEIRRRVAHSVVTLPEVREYFGSRRHRVLGADLLVEDEEPRLTLRLRQAEVAVYDYDHDLLVAVIIDLKSSKVIRINEHPSHQPPPSPEEVEEAGTLALADRSVARKKSGRPFKVTASIAREATTVRHPSRGHRVLSVVFWTSSRRPEPVAGPILVDLSQGKLVEPMIPLHPAIQEAEE